jgi:hypothetical protein
VCKYLLVFEGFPVTVAPATHRSHAPSKLLEADVGVAVRGDDLIENVVLSFSVDKALLAQREVHLRSGGFQVTSTSSPTCARYEIEMGQCGALLLCYTVHEWIHQDLAGLFARHCGGGVIVFVMHPVYVAPSPHAHICLLDVDFPDKLHLIKRAFRANEKSA